MIAMPDRGHAVEQLVHLGLGGDVDAAGRLVDDQDLGLERQPAGEHDLLLIAAGQVADQLVRVGHADVEHRAVALDQGELGPLVDEGMPAQQITERGEREVGAHR